MALDMDKVSYIKNCSIIVREGDGYLFYMDGPDIRIHLDGYAVIPIEEYKALTSRE